MADEDSGILATIDTAAPEGWRKHVAAVMFQLGLGTRKTAEMYAKGREAVDVADGRSLVNKALAQAVASQAIADPEMMERAKARFLSEAFTKQVNLEAVLEKAEQRLLEAPRASASSESETTGAQQTREPDLDLDWATSFTRAAETASSEELRQRLADLLSGEVSSPGTFARSTIRLVSELDRSVLETFQDLAPYIASDAIVTAKGWNSGDYFAKGMVLEDAGLINGVTGSTQKILSIGQDGYTTFVGHDLAIVIHGPSGLELHVSGWLLTKAGREIAKLLPQVSCRPALLLAAENIVKDSITKIDLGRVIYSGKIDLGGDITIVPSESLWPTATT